MTSAISLHSLHLTLQFIDPSLQEIFKKHGKNDFDVANQNNYILSKLKTFSTSLKISQRFF